MAYQRQRQGDGVIRLSDGAVIPRAPGNREWEEFRAWRAAGNNPLPADPAPPADPTDEIPVRRVVRALMRKTNLTLEDFQRD